MRYDVEVETRRPEATHEVIYEESVDTTFHAVACIATGLFYGGWCWTYFLMPYSWQEAELRDSARAAIRKRFKGKKPRLLDGRTTRVGWHWDDPELLVLASDDGDDDVEDGDDGEAAPPQKRSGEPKRSDGNAAKDEDEDEGDGKDDESDEPPPNPGMLGDAVSDVKGAFQGLASDRAMTRTQQRQRRQGSAVYGALETGSSFSPHGTGPAVGYRMGAVRAQLGYGLLSKRLELGHPLSLLIAYEMASGTTLSVSASRYEGHGSRNVRYSSGYDLETEVSWTLAYAQVAIGSSIDWLSKGRVEGYWRAGLGSLMYARFSPDDAGADYHNLGEPQGIVIDEDIVDSSVAGRRPDFGPFVLVGVAYHLN
jgi:hypothetical protein